MEADKREDSCAIRDLLHWQRSRDTAPSRKPGLKKEILGSSNSGEGRCRRCGIEPKMSQS